MATKNTLIMKSFFEKLELLIFNDKIDELAEELIKYLNENSLSQEKSDVLLLGNRHNRLNKEKQLGILNYEDYSIEQAKIVHALTRVIEELKENAKEEKSKSVSTNKQKVEPQKLQVKYHQRNFEQLRKVSYYHKLLSISKNICRIAIENGPGYGTGVLVNNGWLLIHDFVLPIRDEYKNVLAQFNFEDDEFGNLKQFYSYRINEEDCIINNQKGYAFVKLIQQANLPKIEQFSNLKISKKDLNVGDLVSIIQHPNAKPKEIDVNVEIIENKEENKVVYNAITFPGSSGAPVFNDKFEIVGIHTGKTGQDGLKYFTPIKMIVDSLSKEDYDKIFNSSI